MSDNNRPKICKASTSEDMKNENLSGILQSFYEEI